MITQMIHRYHKYHTIPHGSIQILSVTGDSYGRRMGGQAPAIISVRGITAMQSAASRHDTRKHYQAMQRGSAGHTPQKKGLANFANPLNLLARPEGFEPPTLGFVVPNSKG